MYTPVEMNAVTVYRTAFDVSDADVAVLRRCLQRNRQGVFNPGGLRYQASIGKTYSIVKRISKFMSKISIDRGRSLGDVVVLQSEAGCRKQQWHTDYDPDAVTDGDIKPLGLILALEDHTTFEEYPDTTHILNRSDVLIFEGDVVHAGSSYDTDNIRLHAYIDTDGMERTRDTTYLYDTIE